MTDTTTLTEALENLQAAQLACEKALEYIENHNIDEDAHADIRSELNKIKNDGAIYTNDQIEQIVEDGLKEHVEAELEEAHPKFKEYSEEITTKYTELEGRISSLEALIRGTTDDGTVTNLNRAIQAVENEYATKLENLNSSYQLAIANNDTELATQITNRITQLLEEKNAKILEVIEKYGSANTPSTGDEDTETSEP